MTIETVFHGEAPPTTRVCAGEGPLLLMEGADVAKQVEAGGVGPLAVLSGTFQNYPSVAVDDLMLLQVPAVRESLGAVTAAELGPMPLSPVGQILGPRLPTEVAALLGAGISSVHFLMAFELTGHAEAHVAAAVRTPVLRGVGVELAHVGLQQLLLLELLAAALVATDVGTRPVVAADVALAVGIGGESLCAVVLGARERSLSAVSQRVTRQVVRARERLPAVLMRARVRLDSGVFT